MKPMLALAATGLLAAASLPAAPLTAGADGRGAAVVRVAVYRGPAACEDCAEAMARAFARLSPRYRVDFVGPGERLDVTPAVLARYRVYVQPGGGQDLPGALASMGPVRIAAIRRFVAAGGGYLGLCMGAYLADGTNIGLVPGEFDSEVERPGFAARTIADAAVPVRWAGKPVTVYYQDGPYLAPRPGDRAYRPIAFYQNGDLAAARYGHGRGLVVLSGPHPEADRGWFKEADLPTRQMPGNKPLKQLVEQLDV